MKNKNRKRRKEGSVEAGLAEADARVDEDLHAKTQGDALHEVRSLAWLTGRFSEISLFGSVLVLNEMDRYSFRKCHFVFV